MSVNAVTRHCSQYAPLQEEEAGGPQTRAKEGGDNYVLLTRVEAFLHDDPYKISKSIVIAKLNPYFNMLILFLISWIADGTLIY